MKIAGLDIGTTGCKLTVFDENGTQLGKAYRDYPVRRAVSGHEIDISTMMESVYAVIKVGSPYNKNYHGKRPDRRRQRASSAFSLCSEGQQPSDQKQPGPD